MVRKTAAGSHLRKRAGTQALRSTGSPPPDAVRPLPPTEAEVAERAYYLYLARGSAPGSEFDDWIQADRSLRDGRDEKSA